MKLFTFWRSLATFRVRIALNLKGLKPEQVQVDLIKGDQLLAEYRAVNPQMVIPALVDGDGPILFQSLAIMEYLDETHPNPPLLPTAPRDRAWVRGLAQIVACDSHPLVVPRIRNYLTDELKLDEATRAKWIRHWVGEALTALEGHLSRDKRPGRFCVGTELPIWSAVRGQAFRRAGKRRARTILSNIALGLTPDMSTSRRSRPSRGSSTIVFRSMRSRRLTRSSSPVRRRAARIDLSDGGSPHTPASSESASALRHTVRMRVTSASRRSTNSRAWTLSVRRAGSIIRNSA